MKRKTWLAGAAALVAATLAGGVVAACGSGDASSAAKGPPPNTAKVEKGKLSDLVSVDGTLTYRARADGSPYPVINRASGTYTALPEDGDEVDCGDVLYRVDDKPVLLLCGRVPAYRDLHEGDVGRDVRQLNRNLHTGDGDTFTWQTEKALEGLQHAKGLDESGKLDVDAAVFLPKPVRIAKVSGELGGSARSGAQVAQATTDTPDVQVNLDASQQGEVKKGDRARVTLPSNESLTGKVIRLGRVAGSAGIPAYIGLDHPGKARALDKAPVRVEITTTGVKSALSVPVTAVVGKSGGGFAVEVVRDGGRRELVAVKLGLFDTAGGRVEVDGDLAEGDRVVVPSS